MAKPDPEVEKLIKRLILGTQGGRVHWEVVNSKWLTLKTPGANVTIRSDDEYGDGHPYTFEFYDAEGSLLGKASTAEGEYYASWEQDLEGLFKAARNEALGVDRVIDELANALRLPELPADDDIPF